MKERPILFSGPMVRAILAGKKTQTRRVVRFRITDPDSGCDVAGNELNSMIRQGVDVCPYGRAGDHLWVRETWGPADGGFCYRASEGPTVKPDDGRWHPSIHMFREASRITLEIESVRVERIKNISTADCVAEGIEERDGKWGVDGVGLGFGWNDPIIAFQELWDYINADRGFGWSINPWVWVIGFRRINP